MRAAMAEAEVGDDVYGEDPSINLLQERVAALLGKEAGLFVPSGTMSNQIAVKTHTQPGDEIICERNCHIYNYEAAGTAFHSLVQVRALDGHDGVMNIHDIEQAIRPDNIHQPRTALITLENTHNRAGGTIYPLNEIKKIARLARKRRIPLHLDGARLFNAAVATGIDVEEWAKYCDSVSVCFSKGLGAPVGSVLTGTQSFIRKARKYRKIFGGGMRQAGVLAAACLYALDHHIDRLAIDHQNAATLAANLADIPGLFIDLCQVQTNMVMIYVRHPRWTAVTLAKRILDYGIAANAVDQERIRAVTHLDISIEQIHQAIAIFRRVCSE